MDVFLADPRVDLDARHVVSPALAVRITATGIVVARLTGTPESRLEHDRMALQHADHVVALDTRGLQLVAALGQAPGAPAAAIDRVVGEPGLSADDRADLEDLVADLVSGGLLLPDDGPAVAATGDWRPVLGPAAPPEPTPTAHLAPQLACPVPVAFPAGADGFELHDHDGSVRATLGVSELLVAAAFATPRGIDEVIEAFAAGAPDLGPSLAEDDVRTAVARLATLDLLRPHDPNIAEAFREGFVRRFRALDDSDAALRAVFEEERARAAETGIRRAIVVPVDADVMPPLSLGMIVAYARAHATDAIDEHFRFGPLWYTDPLRVRNLLPELADWPIVFMYSNYVWTSQTNMAISAAASELLPNVLNVHGGPDTPKYEADAEAYFARHPSVGVAVRGEGEASFAGLLDALATCWPDPPAGADRPDLTPLAAVAGITFRDGDRVVRSPDRDRIAELDEIPSPYLTGLFDHLDRRPWNAITLETNRGCPYGCTFCDWGSATLSRIRKFDLDRVKAEMEWAAQRGIAIFGLADANFGMLDRDVEITEWAIELKQRYGFPTEFQVNYAKNKVGNLARIVRLLAAAGILTQGLVSMQSMDKGVLKTIRRSNIKLERYDALAVEFQSAGLPLYTDIMVGLPGSTVDTVRRDFQTCIDREVHIKAHPTQLLVNSPMNDPEYRAEHGIVAEPSDILRQTTTFTRSDWDEMMAMRQFIYLAERRGLLRQVATYVRAERGLPEADFYDLVRRAGNDWRRWPQLAYATSVAAVEFVPPGSWVPLVGELGRFVTSELGVADDTALATVLAVQHALFPMRGRTFPETLALDHDYVGWHQEVLAAKQARPDGTWPEAVAPLRSFGPGTFLVEDEDHCCENVIGQSVLGFISEVFWELDTPIARQKQRNA